MKLIFVISISFLSSCDNADKKTSDSNDTIITKKIVKDSIKTNILHPTVDSFINQFNLRSAKLEKRLYKVAFDFNNYSTEGGEGFAYYDKDTKKLRKADIYLYEHTKQIHIKYNFFIDKVKAKETVYKYKKNIQDVNSDKDMINQASTHYTIYLKGEITTELGRYRFDVFQEFKKLVPVSIKL